MRRPARSRGGRGRAPLARRGLGWCALLALYWLLAGSVSGPELLTGVAVATLAASWSAAMRRCSPVRFAATRRDLRHWAAALAALAPALGRMTVRLAQVCARGDGTGGLLRTTFEYGSRRSARAHARRVTALLIGSLGPASYVLRMGPRRDTVLLHDFGQGRPADRRWLA